MGELGAEEGLIEKLKEIPQVVDVFETIGTHDMMVNALTAREHKIWVEIYAQLSKIFATDVVGVGLILRWLMGQAADGRRWKRQTPEC